MSWRRCGAALTVVLAIAGCGRTHAPRQDRGAQRTAWSVSAGAPSAPFGERVPLTALVSGGHTVAAWSVLDATTGAEQGALKLARSRRPTALRGVRGNGPVRGAAGQIAMTVVRGAADLDEEARRSLDVLVGPPQGPLHATRLTTAEVLRPTALAASPRGDLAVAWVECPKLGACAFERLRLAVRGPGGRFGRPRTLAETQIADAREIAGLAFDENGTLMVAYLTRDIGAIGVRVAPPGGRLGRERRITMGQEAAEGPVRAAIAPTGRMAVASGTFAIRAAVSDPGAEGFRPARRLEADAHRGDERGGFITYEGDVQLAMDRIGRVVATWSEHDNLRMSTAGRSGQIGRPALLTPSCAGPHDLAVAPDGRALVAWADAAKDAIVARGRRPRARRFSRGERVHPDALVDAISASYDATTGRPTLVWAADSRLFTARRRP